MKMIDLVKLHTCKFIEGNYLQGEPVWINPHYIISMSGLQRKLFEKVHHYTILRMQGYSDAKWEVIWETPEEVILKLPL